MARRFIPVVATLLAAIGCSPSDVGEEAPETSATAVVDPADMDRDDEAEVLTGAPDILLGKWAEGADRPTPAIRHLSVHTNQLLSIVRSSDGLSPQVLTYHRIERSGDTYTIYSEEIGEQPLSLVFTGRDEFTITQPESWASAYQRAGALPPEFLAFRPSDIAVTEVSGAESPNGVPKMLSGTWKQLGRGNEEVTSQMLAIHGTEMVHRYFRIYRKFGRVEREHYKIQHVERSAGEITCVIVDRHGSEVSQKWVLSGNDVFSIPEFRATFVRGREDQESAVLGRGVKNTNLKLTELLGRFQSVMDESIRRYVSSLCVRNYLLLGRERGNELTSPDSFRPRGVPAVDCSFLAVEVNEKSNDLTASERDAVYELLLQEWETWATDARLEARRQRDSELAEYRASSQSERQSVFERIVGEALRENNGNMDSARVMADYESAISPSEREKVLSLLIRGRDRVFDHLQPSCLEVWEGLHVIRVGEIHSDKLPKPHVLKWRG